MERGASTKEHLFHLLLLIIIETYRRMIYVYVLRSDKTGMLYKGLTKDLERRIKEHNAGYSKSTKAHRPWHLVYQEGHNNMRDARAREKFLKSGSGREFLRAILEDQL